MQLSVSTRNLLDTYITCLTTACLVIAKGTAESKIALVHSATQYTALARYTFALCKGALQHFFNAARKHWRSVANVHMCEYVSLVSLHSIRFCVKNSRKVLALSPGQHRCQLRSKWKKAGVMGTDSFRKCHTNERPHRPRTASCGYRGLQWGAAIQVWTRSKQPILSQKKEKMSKFLETMAHMAM